MAETGLCGSVLFAFCVVFSVQHTLAHLKWIKGRCAKDRQSKNGNSLTLSSSATFRGDFIPGGFFLFGCCCRRFSLSSFSSYSVPIGSLIIVALCFEAQSSARAWRHSCMTSRVGWCYSQIILEIMIHLLWNIFPLSCHNPLTQSHCSNEFSPSCDNMQYRERACDTINAELAHRLKLGGYFNGNDDDWYEDFFVPLKGSKSVSYIFFSFSTAL